uniref:mechanosensitive ion channel family protein n=1 Tax=Fulvivirga sp. TaxID=1931237 RepID=UPI004049D054
MKRIIPLILVLLFGAQILIGQVPAPDLKTPQSALTYFFNQMQDENFAPEKAAQLFSSKSISKEEKVETAIKLKQFLDGGGHYIDLEYVPNEPKFYDSTEQMHIYVLVDEYPNLFLQLKSGKWVFSDKAIKEIDILHGSIFQFGSDKLLQYLPKIGTNKILGLRLWQHVGIGILLFFCFLLQKLLTLLFEWIIYRYFIQRGKEKIANKYVLPVARPLGVFCIIFLLINFIPALVLPADISHYTILILKTLQPLFGTIVVYRIVDIIAVYLDKLAKNTESTLDDQLVPLFRKTLKTFVVAIGTIVMLGNLNVPILPLLTGLSIGGLAFALAAQDTIKNFFGSMMIFIDKPFQIGHWITSGDIDGSVEEVGFRSTRVRTFRNSVVYVPNGKLADSTIDNHGLRQYRRFFTQLALTYDTPPHLIQTFVDGLIKIVEQHPDTRKDYYNIYLNEMSAYSLNVMFYIFFEVPGWPEELKARHEILMKILSLAKELNVHFAFPTQTMHIENFPGQRSLSPVYENQEIARMKLEGIFKSEGTTQ